MPPTLTLCHGCEQYVHPGTEYCPFCGGDVDALMEEHDEQETAIAEAAARVREILARNWISLSS